MALTPWACRRTGIASLALSLLACDNSTFDDRPEREGELGAGTFRYICVGSSDPYCEEGFVASTFPDRFAVGAVFDLDYDPADSFVGPDGPLPQVVTAAPDSVDTQSMAFMFQRPGFAAMLARNGAGEVIDLRHLYGAAVAEIAVFTMDSQALRMIEVEPGLDLDVRVEPRDETDSLLAGSLSYAWSTDDPEIAEVVTTDRDRVVTLRAHALGETTLHIMAGGFDQSIPIIVGSAGSTTGTTSDGTTSDVSTGDGTTGASTSDGTTSGDSTSDGTTSGGSTGEGSTGGDTDTDTDSGSTGGTN